MKCKISLLLALILFISTFTLSSCEKTDKDIIKSISQLNSKDYTITVDTGSAAASSAKNTFTNANITYSTSHNEAYLAVSSGKADAFAYGRLYMEYALASGAYDNLAIMDGYIDTADIGAGINPKRNELVGLFNSFIDRIKADGTFDDMYDRWVINAKAVLPVIPKAENPTTTIRFGTSGTVVPMNYYGENNQLIGFDIELMQRFALFANADFTIETMGFNSLVASLQADRLDIVISDLNITEERKEIIDFSNPYLISETAIIVQADRLPKESAYASLDELNGETLGVPAGASYVPLVREKFPDSKIIELNSPYECTEALKNGRISAYIVDEPMANSQIKETTGLISISEYITEDYYGFMLNKKNKALCSEIDTVIEKFRNDGTLDRLEKKWITGSGEQTIKLDENADKSKGTLNIGVPLDALPFSYVSSEETVGYDVELIYLIGQELGYDVKLTPYPFTSLISGLEADKIDIAIGCLTYTAERAESVLFTATTYESGVVAVVEKIGTDEAVTSLDDLNGKPIGYATGASYVNKLKEGFPNSDIIEYNSFPECIQALKTGKIVAYFTDEPMAKYQASGTSGIVPMDEMFTHDRYGFMLNKKDEVLCADFNVLLEKYKKDGVLDALKDEWINGAVDKKIDIDENADTSKGTLKVGMSLDSVPFAYLSNEEIIGYDVELITMLAQDLGYDVELISYDFGALMPGLVSEKIDVAIGCITYTTERAETVLFTDSTYDSGTVAVIRESTEENGGIIAYLKDSFEKTFIRENRWKLIVDGLWITVQLSLASLILGTLLGFLYSFLLSNKNKAISKIAGAVSTLLDGLPLLIVLMVMYYIIFAKTNLPAILIGIVGISVDFANGVAGMLNTGLKAVDKGQIEAATSMGYKKWQIFTKISFPQAANHMFSSYAGAVIALVKGTSVIGYITVQDLTKAGDIIRSLTYDAFFPLIVVAIIYFALARIFVAILSVFAKKLDPKRRKRQVKGVKIND